MAQRQYSSTGDILCSVVSGYMSHRVASRRFVLQALKTPSTSTTASVVITNHLLHALAQAESNISDLSITSWTAG